VSRTEDLTQLRREIIAAHQSVTKLKNRARRLLPNGSPVWLHLLDAEIKLWDAHTDLTIGS